MIMNMTTTNIMISVSTGEAKSAEEADAEATRTRMKGIKHKLLVLSGKGGVGKSTLSVQVCELATVVTLQQHDKVTKILVLSGISDELSASTLYVQVCD